MQFIDLKKQYQRCKPTVDAAIQAVLDHGQYIMGPEITALEQRLAKRAGVSHAIGVASGTTALQIALMALDVQAGDEVITSPFSFFATYEVIALLGAVPVYVDIDPETYNLDTRLLAAAMTDKTKAIMPVSMYGQCCDMDAINAIAAAHQVAVIEDAAQSFGATYRARPSCGLSTIACTSFFPSKPLGCYGDGGACFTDDAALADKMRSIANHGQDGRYHHTVLGFNGRMDSIQAAVLLAKCDIFAAELAARQQVAQWYDAALQGVVATPIVAEYNTSIYAQYTIQVDDRSQVQQALREQSIPTAVHYPVGLHQQPIAEAQFGSKAGQFPHAERAAERVLSLPFDAYLDQAGVAKVAAALQLVLAGCSAA